MAQQPPAGGPMTTIVPFNDNSKLPACAAACGPLYDANGGCVPPAVAQGNADSYAACFCANSKVAPFSTGTAGVCDTACTADPNGLASIQGWFTGLCNVKNAGGGGKTDTAATKTTTGKGKSTGTNSVDFSSPQGDGGDWLSNHWQWVVMIVVLVVGIAAIWVGACIWRRRYLRKKDRQTSLGQKHSGSARNPSWGPTITGSDSATPMNYAAGHDAERGVSEKPRKSKQKKKWTVSQRT